MNFICDNIFYQWKFNFQWKNPFIQKKEKQISKI